MNELRDHLRQLIVWCADRRLCIVRSSSSIDAITPNVRTQIAKRKSRFGRDQPHTERGAGLALARRAEIEVIDARTDRFSKDLAFGWASAQEVISEVHVATVWLVIRSPIIDQNDLLRQSFLLVYHFDVRA